MKVQARRRGRLTYYYLTQSYRQGGRVRKVEIYLGKRLPHDLARRKSDLGTELLLSQFGPDLGLVRDGYRENQRKMPSYIQEKELESFGTLFTYDSNKIEGSSLTLQETGLLLREGVTPSNRPLSDVIEALAHQRVFLDALRRSPQLDLRTLLEWHRQLFNETKPDLAGRVRQVRVRISGSSFEPPLPVELDLLLTEFFDWYKRVRRTLHPVVLAALVHFRLVSIHPFGDGNGRVTRLAVNFVLHRRQYPLIDIPYTKRAGYYRALESAHISEDESKFVRWFLRTYLTENLRYGMVRAGHPSEKKRK